MSTFVLLAVTGCALGALYFLLAAGLSLIWGLMRVLNFAHGAFFTVAAYAAWSANTALPAASPWVRWCLALLAGALAGGAFAWATEIVLIRPLYARHVDQILVTVGLAIATLALVEGAFGSDAREFTLPAPLASTSSIFGSAIPNTRLVVGALAAGVFAALQFFILRTRYGAIIRAGVENRAMVSALGIDSRRAFTLVFTLGGVAAGLAGGLGATYYGTVDPVRGTALLISAFIVVVIGGLGSLSGSALAALGVGLLQQFLNYYAAPGAGDLTVVTLLAAVLLARPQGLFGNAP